MIYKWDEKYGTMYVYAFVLGVSIQPIATAYIENHVYAMLIYRVNPHY